MRPALKKYPLIPLTGETMLSEEKKELDRLEKELKKVEKKLKKITKPKGRPKKTADQIK